MLKKRFMQAAVLQLLMVLSLVSAWAWTTPIQLSDPNYDTQWPRLARADNGAVHMVYRFRFKPWWIAYRYRDAAGTWTPIFYINNMYYVDQPDIIQDSQGRANVFYCAGTGTPWDG